MMSVAISFLILHRKKAQAYFMALFKCFEISHQTIDVMCRLVNKRSVYYSVWPELIKYYLAKKTCSWVRLGLFV